MLYPHSVCEAILYGLDRVNMAKDDPIPGFASIAAEVSGPNPVTKKALQELEQGGGERFGTSTKEAFRHVLAVRKKWRA
jgi:hypothetical protein